MIVDERSPETLTESPTEKRMAGSRKNLGSPTWTTTSFMSVVSVVRLYH